MQVFFYLGAALFLVWCACSIGCIIDFAFGQADLKAEYKRNERENNGKSS